MASSRRSPHTTVVVGVDTVVASYPNNAWVRRNERVAFVVSDNGAAFPTELVDQLASTLWCQGEELPKFVLVKVPLLVHGKSFREDCPTDPILMDLLLVHFLCQAVEGKKVG